jgi:IMP cyclohydrolase
MYVGRIVSVGKNKDGKLVAMYRVSSRSFPNRRSKDTGSAISIVPKEGFEKDIYKSPYISYNCLRLAGSYAVATNGSQTDPIAEKLGSGLSMRDAMVSVLYGMDYEHDDYNTPRIAAIVDKNSSTGVLGIVRKDALLVQDMKLKPGEAFYVATYEHNYPGIEFHDAGFDVADAGEACDYILGKGVFADLERPISAAGAIETGSGFTVAFKDMAD